MKIVFYLLLVLFLVGCEDNSNSTDPATPSEGSMDMLPLAVGNTWTFESDRGGTLDTCTFAIPTVETDNETGNVWYDVDIRGGHAPNKHLRGERLRRISNDTLFYYAGGSGDNLCDPLFGYNSWVDGDTLFWRGDPIYLLSTGHAVSTPAGMFSDCYLVVFYSEQDSKLYYKRGVGLVRSEHQSGDVHQLIDYSVH